MKENICARHTHLRQLICNALFAAVLCVLSPLAIPVGPIPVTLGLFVVLLAGVTLSPLNSAQAVAVYLALGLCGLPVFSGGQGGAQVFFGPTGGYLWSYILVAPLIGLLRRLIPTRPDVNSNASLLLRSILELGTCLVGVALCYLGGTVQFCLLTGQRPADALAVCVLPFLPFDLLKGVAAVAIGTRIRKAMCSVIR